MTNNLKIWRILLLLQLLAMVVVITSAYLGHPLVYYKEFDFYTHFALFGFTSYLAYRSSNRKKVYFLNILWPLWPMMFLVISSLEEGLQSFSIHRTFSMWDMAGNFLGIICFYLIDTWLLNYNLANR